MEQKQKAGAKTQQEELKFKSLMEKRSKESMVKSEKDNKIKESTEKKAEKRTKVLAQENAIKSKESAEKSQDQRKVVLQARYAADIANPNKFPPVCMSSKARTKYSPTSPPMNSAVYEVLSALLEKQSQAGGGMIQGNWAKKNNLGGRLKMKSKLEKFQRDNNIDDGPGCAGENTWKALISCPLPLTTAMCHVALPCVLALQTLLFQYLPEGRKNGRYCKQTMNQMRLFQRLYQLDPHGNTYELDFITLIRRNGMRDSIGNQLPPAFQP